MEARGDPCTPEISIKRRTGILFMKCENARKDYCENKRRIIDENEK
jgi:hypothetical protein